MATDVKITMKELRGEVQKSLNQMANDIYLALIRNTPKRSGAASRGWTKPGTISRDNYSAVITTNRVPYVERLNEGWSKQAPAGYIEQTTNQIMRRYKK
jgi:hypothetical protein